MKTTEYYPVLQTRDVAATTDFYKRHFGFSALFDSDWYVHLQSPEDPSVNLGILQFDHPSIPEAGRGRVSDGMLLNFEVSDVDSVHERLMTEGMVPVQPLRDEPFGQRHVILQGPDGVLIDIITPIPPAPDYAAAFSGGTAT
jgi:catechol 2,3-dioxygenase-like lactoylglutathione lyase family enzyme